MTMTEIYLEPGAFPWELTRRGSETIETLNFYDLPLSGIVRQGSRTVLYQCVNGHFGRVNFWHYTVLSDDEVHEIQSVVGDALRPILSRFSGRPGVLAVAADWMNGIVDSTDVELRVNGREAMDHLVGVLNHRMAETQHDAVAAAQRPLTPA
jgi:hypothetical protein